MSFFLQERDEIERTKDDGETRIEVFVEYGKFWED